MMFLMGFGVLSDGDVVVVNAKLIGDRFEVGMVADDQRDVGVVSWWFPDGWARPPSLLPPEPGA